MSGKRWKRIAIKFFKFASRALTILIKREKDEDDIEEYESWRDFADEAVAALEDNEEGGTNE